MQVVFLDLFIEQVVLPVQFLRVPVYFILAGDQVCTGIFQFCGRIVQLLFSVL